MIPSAIPDRVGRLLPLLGSDKPGEVANAVQAILRDLLTVGLDYHGVEFVRKAPRGYPAPAASAPMPQFFDMARACRDLDDGQLNDWEHGFIGDMCRRGRTSPTVRQMEQLSRIFARLQRRAAA